MFSAYKKENIPRGLFNADEKLWSVCIFASIGHRQPSSSIMLQLEVLISKFSSIDGNSTGSFKYGKKSVNMRYSIGNSFCIYENKNTNEEIVSEQAIINYS